MSLPSRPIRILLVVTGGIAAYKAADLVRELRRGGADVRVVMTAAAQHFVTPLTFQALSGHRVHTDLLDPDAEAGMGHIELARWPDRIVVAPATADFLARLAQGRADDLPAALCLASRAPIMVAPAMNHVMWEAGATRENLATLHRRGVACIGPEVGEQACGESGEGRMSDPAAIAAALLDAGGAAGPWAGRTVLITAGPTREPLDPVRYLTNRSSGRMGFALAAAAREAGARVILVAGPTALATPPGVERVDVERAGQMYDAVLGCIDEADCFIAAAAVSDYRPEREAPEKIKKGGDALTLALEPTPDTLRAVAARSPRPFVVGFAAETERVSEYARRKLNDKDLDLIAANRVGPGQGFDTDDNALEVLWRDGSVALAEQPKTALARELLQIVAERAGFAEATRSHHAP
ncbi:bifunctional phosphopantothenoylcysteine decarboxylase/phosphopantothenate--cysteine ligase CoaBC [Halorhodospira halophila]|uniref:Coenzyme A biosynthesis bifunctional protein CoaBC n=1 Tax=Halorhodospira halophila (strain DSM 244 / SL1) TaxID=349124 RepID=A1WZF0_HALHL|nr:bifunctional phosphopantothenoylcysteine decarboxylase/phosphopantothenate--cysteine ligase CoaBC [Halorhodospira halophila]ABM63062.1 Phosphopantothenoylcysteine decarboxylase / Phosphopantothenate-cysteine ligase [Halorhodospira halophila SL1]MBK1727816.1 bifunctional phosphopantothenoylcysteine decarboxylase/phosphopantothenate--cysteine ligase CoaBC [Halorhodospira halophila]